MIKVLLGNLLAEEIGKCLDILPAGSSLKP